MDKQDQGFCAHLRVKYAPREVAPSRLTDWWECFDCRHRFIPVAPAGPAQPKPQMTAAERDAFTRARQEFDNGETVPAPAPDVVKKVAIAIAQEDGYGRADADWIGSPGKVYLAQAAAALAVAREGWVSASEMERVEKKLINMTESAAEYFRRAHTAEQQLEGMVPVSQLQQERDTNAAAFEGVTQELRKSIDSFQQQLSTMYSLEQVEKALLGDFIFPTESRAQEFAARVRARLTAQPTEQERVTDSIALEMVAEVKRAKMHGAAFASLHEAYAVILEELDEVWDITRMKRRDRSAADLRKEFIQLGAMALKAIGSMDNFIGGKV